MSHGATPGPKDAPEGETTFDVRIWGVRRVERHRSARYELRWRVGKKPRSKTFSKKALAESYRSDLVSRANRGEAFDVVLGIPVSMVPREEGISWWEWAVRYAAMKWPTLAPSSRRSLAEGLCTITMAVLIDVPDRPNDAELRAVMQQWAFLPPKAALPPPDELAEVASWLARGTWRLRALEQTAFARAVLDAIALKQDGTAAAATTIARRRAVFFNALQLAEEAELIDANPLAKVRWRTPKQATAVDPACVCSPDQARRLLDALANLAEPGETNRKLLTQAHHGRRLVAFFGTMYYAGLRPSEALALEVEDLDLPATDDAWGTVRVGRSDAEVCGRYSDTGKRQARQLKHRARGEVRIVPCAPPLVALLHVHLQREGSPSTGRLFAGPKGGTLTDQTYLGVWRAARKRAFSRRQAASRLVRRPYDLRHSCVSTWLAAGVDSAQIAVWVGHSVAVLHRVYAHVLPGRERGARQAIEEVLR